MVFRNNAVFILYMNNKNVFYLFVFNNDFMHIHVTYLVYRHVWVLEYNNGGQQGLNQSLWKANLQLLTKKANAVTVALHILHLGHVSTESFSPKHIFLVVVNASIAFFRIPAAQHGEPWNRYLNALTVAETLTAEHFWKSADIFSCANTLWVPTCPYYIIAVSMKI